MALTEKDILSLLEIDLPEDATVEQLQEAFNEKFISLKMAGADPRVIGRINGAMGQKLKKMFDPIVGGWEDGETDWSVPEKVAEAASAKLAKQKENYETALTELRDAQKTGTKKDQNEALEKLQREKEAIERTLLEERGMRENVANEFNSFKELVAQEKRQQVLSSKINEARSKVKISIDDELKLEGFNSKLSQLVKWDLSEDGKDIVPINTENGERFKTPGGTDWETAENVISRFADKYGVLQKNSGKSDMGNQQQQQQNSQQNNQQQNTNTRPMAPEVQTSVVRA